MADKIGGFIGVAIWLAILVGAPVYSMITSGSDSSEAKASESVESSDTYQSSSYSEPSEDSYSDSPEAYDSSDYSSDYETQEYDEYESSYDYDSSSSYNYNEDYNAATDLDCADIGYRHYVGSYDPNGLDGDGDGIACESW